MILTAHVRRRNRAIWAIAPWFIAVLGVALTVAIAVWIGEGFS